MTSAQFKAGEHFMAREAKMILDIQDRYSQEEVEKQNMKVQRTLCTVWHSLGQVGKIAIKFNGTLRH